MMIQLLLGGLALGAVYALLALGFVVVFRSSGVVNFAHPALLMIGAYVIARVSAGSRPFLIALLAGVLAAVAGLFLITFPSPGLQPVSAAVALRAFPAAIIGGLDSIGGAIAGRLRGIYLGIATLGLVFLGQHILANTPRLTGGDNGRSVPPLPGSGTDPGGVQYLLNVEWGREQQLWYPFLAGTVLAYVVFRAVTRSHIGRALRAVRDRELMAGIVGVPVIRFKAYAFLISSMYAGLGGVLLALVFRRVVPETFGIALSIEYLAMVVIGGLGVAGGAIAGAAFVACLPSILERYAGLLPGLAAGPTDAGISAPVAGKFLYGAAIIAVLLLEPEGLAGLARRLRRTPASSATPDSHQEVSHP